jgi:integrase
MGRRARGEGALYQRKNGLWVAESLAGGNKKYLYARTKKAAYEKKKEYEQKIDQPVPVIREVEIEEFLADWLYSVKGTVKDRTYERYEQTVRLHLFSLYGLYLHELKAKDLESLYQSKLETLSPRSVQIIHRTISKALKQAVRLRLVERNVADEVAPPRSEYKEIRTLSREEVNWLLRLVRGTRYEAVYTLAVTTGMREGEILGLKWTDLDLEQERLRIQRTLWKRKVSAPKSRSSVRAIPLNDHATDVLRRYRGSCEEGRFPISEWLVSTSNGTPVSCHNFLNRSWYPLLEEMGLDRMPFHNLRHTCATLLLASNVHPKMVQSLLGHSSIEITLNTYSHVLPEMQGVVVAAMDEILEEPSKPWQ